MVINTSLGIGMTTAFFISPTITTGVSALAIWQIGISFQSNRHSRIASIVASSLFSVYMAALGLYEFTLCASAGIARSSVQTMIADDRPATRAAVAIVGFFATALVYTSTTALNSLATLEHAPLITLGLGALGGAFCERLSWATRLTQLSGALLSLAYHSLVSGSALGLVGTILFLPGVLRSIYIYDLNKLWKQKKPSQPLASK
jgi:hypothetical protein